LAWACRLASAGGEFASSLATLALEGAFGARLSAARTSWMIVAVDGIPPVDTS
jgi:hypothetical protein